jgi:hypothetical protein
VRDGSNFQNRRKFWTASLKFFDPNRPGGYPEFEPVSHHFSRCDFQGPMVAGSCRQVAANSGGACVVNR